MTDVAVIGAGISGMTAAAVLASRGISVALVEKAPVLGPLVGGFRRGGLRCDTGFHLAGGLAGGEILDRYFRFVGIDRRLEVLPAPPGGAVRIRCLSPGFEMAVPEGTAAVRDALAAAFPGETAGIDAFLSGIEDLYRTLPFVGLAGPIDGRREIGAAGGPTLQEALDGATADPLLQGVLAAPTFLYGVTPREAPMPIHAGVAAAYHRSARAVAGGGAAIVEALGSVLSERGVEVRLGDGAESVIARDGGVTGVRLASGETIRCSTAIATVHPRLALRLAPEGAFRPAMAGHLAGLEESMAACVLHAVSGRWRAAFGRSNLVIMPTPGAFASPTAGPIASRPLYLAPSPTPSADAEPEGFTVIVPTDASETAAWAASRHGERPAGYGAYKESVAAAAAARVRGALPELDGDVRIVDVATPLTYRDLAHAATGAMYGVKHRVGQINPLPITRTRGFLLAGQAVAAPGVMGAMISAFMACARILGADELRRGLEGAA